MATFLIVSNFICERNIYEDSSSVSIELMGSRPTPRKQFEADKLPDVIREYEAFIAANADNPLPLQYGIVHRAGRKPNGYEKATECGGPLYRRNVNLEAATVKDWRKSAA